MIFRNKRISVSRHRHWWYVLISESIRISWNGTGGTVLISRRRFVSIGIPIVKLRRSHYPLILLWEALCLKGEGGHQGARHSPLQSGNVCTSSSMDQIFGVEMRFCWIENEQNGKAKMSRLPLSISMLKTLIWPSYVACSAGLHLLWTPNRFDIFYSIFSIGFPLECFW